MIIKDNKQTGQFKDIDTQKGIVQMYVNAFGNVDSDNDISEKGSFTKTIKENGKRVKHFLNHSWEKLIGVPVEMKEDDTGLMVTSQLNLKSQLGQEVFEFYKLYAEQGMTLEHSVGLDAVRHETSKDTGIRTVKEWKLWEYSTLYAWGANEQTPLVDLKNYEPNKAIEILNVILTKGNFKDEIFKQVENKINELKALIKNAPLIDTHNDAPLTLNYMINKINF